MRKLLAQLHRNRAGATMLEWTLLLAVIVLPSYILLRVALEILTAHYRLIVTLNGLPLP